MKSKIERLGKVSITVEKNYWDKNKAYNRLTIVERQGTRTAYLSRKVVPIGVDITDRNYWITISKWADIPYEIVQEFGDSTEVVISQKVVTLKVNELQGLIDNINEIIGEGGSIDERITTAISNAKTELIDGASEEGDTLKKLEDRLSDVEESVGEGGSVDERIAEEGARHYTKEETYSKGETYSKVELNNLITTPNQQYVSVASYEDLPATGSADTVYRVGGTTSYSEYAWDGTQYVHLSTKTQIGEVFDISAYRATGGTLATYADLAAALSNDNVPTSIRRGGMSVKFVQSSDNKYVRFNLLAQEFTTNETQWQGVDVNPTDGSHNLVESGGVKKELTLLKDNFGGVNLEEITFVNGKYIDTSGSTVPTDNGEIVYTDRGSERCAAIQVTPGDVFLLNNRSGNSKWRAYGWAKSDFTFIDKTGGTYTCVEEVVVAPANAAWLILNDVNPNVGKYCYKGKNIQAQIDEKIALIAPSVTDAQNETKDLKIGQNHYLLSSDTASKRLVTELSLASGTGTVSTTASSNINIIRSNTPVTTVKKGSTIKVVTTGIGDVIKQITLLLNDNKYISIVDAELLYTTDVDITTVRVYVSPSNVIVNGNVSVTITLPSVYDNIGFETNKTAVIPELKLKSQESDVYGNILISPIWRQIKVDGNLNAEASSEYLTCDSIPVDNIAFLRITSEYDYVVFFLNSNKQKITFNSYSGNQVLALNDYIKNSDIKYIRVRVHTANSANIILRCDTIISRYNNKRLLSNKNIKCFAHRGSSLLSTEASGDNYPTSIWGSYINGFDGVHVNIQFTTDHVPYCLHDTTFVDDTTQQTITLCDCTSVQIDTYTRNGLPIAKVESAIYMAKMLGLDVIIYNIYGTKSNDNYDALINIVKKYNMFEHIWFGVDGHPSTPNTDYLSRLVAACPKVNILRTQYPLTDTNYSVITDLIADANTLLQTYPQLNIAMWVTPTHIEQHFIDANLAKPYNVKLAAFSVTLEDIEKVMPYVDFISTDRGTWSFGAERRDIEKIVTDKYPEFILGNYGNVV